MGELKIGNFSKPNENKTNSPTHSPFKEKVATGRFGRESLFSKNGVVEYPTGRRPKNDAGVLDKKVILHVGPMKRTILAIKPELVNAPIDTETQELINDLDLINLIDAIEDSTTEDWKEDPILYLGLIRKIEEAELDAVED